MAQFSYKTHGKGNKKIVCVHGFGASGTTFKDILPYFNEDEYQIYMIDLIGFGNSGFIKNWEYTIENQARYLYYFLKNNNLENVTVIGHSYGGGVVLLLLEKLRRINEEELVQNAVLIGPACYPQKIPFFIRIPAENPILYKIFMFFVPKRFLARRMLQDLYMNKTLINEEKIERYAMYFSSNDKMNGIIKTAQHIVPVNVDKFVDGIKHIKNRTLIIWGDKDFVIRRNNILRLHEDIKDSKLVIAEDTGHVVQEEKAELVASEIIKLTE